ncbi:MAG: hypothetical protein HC913_22745 [Microscillaceae bacterium]|nr:hypothetical protein [Microscillaceae bacterium]
MKKISLFLSLYALAFFSACDEKNEGVIEPLTPATFPQVLFLDDEGDGNVEDDDNVGIKITLADRIDPEGEELGGKINPLNQAVTLTFAITDIKGFDQISDYILDGKAFYEVDDCTNSDDLGEDLDFSFNTTTGQGSVTFPAGVEEIEIEFELDEDLFDDDVVNTEDRGFVFQLTGLTGNTSGVVVNLDLEFEYEVLDDEKIFAQWKLDLDEDFDNFKALFSALNEDLADLDVADVDEIVFEFGYDQLTIEIVLIEEEEDDCGELDNIVIELEGEYDDLTDDDVEGELALIFEVELEDESVLEGEFGGEFSIVNGFLTLSLSGELDDEEFDEQTFVLEKD